MPILIASHRNRQPSHCIRENVVPTEHVMLPGIVIKGQIPFWKWKDWSSFIMPLIHEGQGSIKTPTLLGLPLRYIDARFGKLEALHHLFKDIHLKLTPRSYDWMFDVNSPAVKGTFFIPNYDGGTWTAHFDYLYWAKNKAAQKRKIKSSYDPRTIPSIDLEIEKLTYENIDYGKIVLRTRSEKQGMWLDEFAVKSPLFQMFVKGTWRLLLHRQRTSLSGWYYTQDLGKILKIWGLQDAISGGKGISHFALSWRGAPYQMSAKKMTGTMDFKFRHGRILKVDENATKDLGWGRLLNAFSLDALPRRLTLNFSDINAKGLEFHLLEGNLKVKKGIYKTKNTIFDGPVAKLKIKGFVNFSKKKYDLYINVMPHVTSSVPLIVAVIGGPIAGAITWVVNKIAAPEIGKAIGFVYHAKGNFNQPHVMPLPKPKVTRVVNAHDRSY